MLSLTIGSSAGLARSWQEQVGICLSAGWGTGGGEEIVLVVVGE